MPSRRAGEEHVAGELLLDEPVVRLVGVERADDVVAVRPGVGPRLVLVVAVRLAVVDDVEPVPRPALAVVRARRAAGRPASRRRRRPGRRRTRRPPRASAAGRSGRSRAGGSASAGRPRATGVSPFSRSFARTKASIGLRTPAARRPRAAGDRGPGERPERPPVGGVVVGAVARPLRPPGRSRSQDRRPAAAVSRGALRRHHPVLVLARRSSCTMQALGRLARDDRRPAVAPLEGVGLAVEPQAALLLVGPVAAQQCLARIGLTSPVEVDRPIGPRSPGARHPPETRRRGSSRSGWIATPGDSWEAKAAAGRLQSSIATMPAATPAERLARRP